MPSPPPLSPSLAAATALALAIGYSFLPPTSAARTDNVPERSPPPLDPTEYFGSDDGGTFESWYESRGRDSYAHSVFLESSDPEAAASGGGGGGAAILWSIDEGTSSLRLAMAVRARGWAGFGLAEAGGMPGSDVVMFVASDNSTALIDSHVGKEYAPPIPDASQDWTLIDSVIEGGFLIFEGERLLDTSDPYDRSVGYDGDTATPAHRVIAAWGDDPTPAHHGPRRAKGSIRFHAPEGGGSALDVDVFLTSMSEDAEGYIELLNDGYAIPTEETTYHDACFDLSYMTERGMPPDVPLHIIGIEAIVDSPRHLHHLVAFGADGADALGPDDDCESVYGDWITGWAPGVPPRRFPPEAGLPLGPATRPGGGGIGYTMIRIQFHFDNRGGEAGLTDNSGLRLYYTSDLREHDMGMLQLADPAVFLRGSPVGSGLSRHVFACPDSCYESSFVDDEVTVVAESLHMHETGTRMVNEQIRGGEVVRTASVDYFDFPQSGSYVVPQPSYTLRRGDTYRTTCYYDETLPSSSLSSTFASSSSSVIESRTVKNDEVVFGNGSQDEMCIAYVAYYPKQPVRFGICGYNWFFPACEAEYEWEYGIDSVGRAFGTDTIEEEEEEEEGEEDEGAVSDGTPPADVAPTDVSPADDPSDASEMKAEEHAAADPADGVGGGPTGEVPPTADTSGEGTEEEREREEASAGTARSYFGGGASSALAAAAGGVWLGWVSVWLL